MSTSLNELPRIGAPASRGLGAAGFTTLRQLAGVPREDLARLHGVGPKALDMIDAALKEHGLSLR
ncbi:DNA-binding protein [Arthrobacter sp. NPDC055585]